MYGFSADQTIRFLVCFSHPAPCPVPLSPGRRPRQTPVFRTGAPRGGIDRIGKLVLSVLRVELGRILSLA
jgi:hypothetical protein